MRNTEAMKGEGFGELALAPSSAGNLFFCEQEAKKKRKTKFVSFSPPCDLSLHSTLSGLYGLAVLSPGS